MLYASLGLLVFSTVLIALLRQWRAVGPLVVVYAAVLALAQGVLLGPLAGAVALVAGLAAAAILVRGAPARGEAESAGPPEVSRPQYVTLGLLVLAVLGAYALTLSLPPGRSVVLTFAACWLLVVGLLVLLSARSLLRTGLGLFLLAGVSALGQAAVAQPASPILLAAGGLVQVLLALVVARTLAAAKSAQVEVDS